MGGQAVLDKLTQNDIGIDTLTLIQGLFETCQDQIHVRSN